MIMQKRPYRQWSFFSSIGDIFLSDSLHYEKFADGTVKCIEDEIPFEVPEGWAWSRLLSLTVKIGAGSTPTGGSSAYNNMGIKFIRSQNVYNDGLDLANVAYISEELNQKKSGSIVKPKDILLNITGGSIGRCALIPDDFDIANVNQHVIIIRLLDSLLRYFVHKVIISPYIQNQIFSRQVGSGRGGLSAETLSTFLIPIPPHKEQLLIHKKLNDYLFHIRKLSKEKEGLVTLLEATKVKVLNRAIRGKLVLQNPDDEPASVLLEHIRDKKEHLIKEGKIKRDKKESTIFKSEDNSYYEKFADGTIKCIDEEIPFAIPDTWTWSNLQELCNYGECDSIPAEKIPRDAWILDLEDIEKQSGKILQRLTATERQSTSTKHSFRKNMVLYSKLRPYLNKVVLADSDGYCTTEILPLDFIDIIHPRYAQFFLMSPFFVNYAKHCSYGMKMPRLGTKDGKNAYFAIPPYKEQIRIANNIEKIFNTLSNIENAIK